MAEISELEAQIVALGETIGATSGLVAAFEGELARMQDSLVFTGREVNSLSTGIGSGLRRAFDGLVFDGVKLSDALKMVSRSISDTVFNIALKPIQNSIGSILAGGLNGLLSTGMPFEKGGSFSQGRIMPFAKGGVVSSPTQFPMRGGTGLMGEAGPEAIMPLTRAADGSLGVQASGGRSVTVVMNIQTPDVQGFQRSQSQIAAQAMRALGRGQRNR
jgi:hypothetical protein